MVTLPCGDAKIWDVSQRVAEIIKEYQTFDRAHIFLNGEGPCARALGLYDLLDDLCNKFSWEKPNIRIATTNLIEHHDEYVIHKLVPPQFDLVKEFSVTTPARYKDFNDLRHFGIFIGKSNWMRLWLCSVVDQRFKDISLMTFNYDSQSEKHRDHLGLEELLLSIGQKTEYIQWALDLIKKSPVNIDSVIPTYPITLSATYELSKIYHKFFVEVTCETFCRGNTFFPTEKTWRAISQKTPFIVQGPKHYYRNLHKLGFKTFGNWWDEGFTEDEFSHQPVEIIKILEWLSTLSIKEIEALYIDMQSTLEHNYELLMSMKSTDILKIFP